MTVDIEAEEACHLPEVVSSRPAGSKAMVFKVHAILVRGRGMIQKAGGAVTRRRVRPLWKTCVRDVYRREKGSVDAE